MKRNVCRIIGFVLAALMIAAMIPMTALAAEDELYDLWVGGERFTVSQSSFSFGDGTASFDAATSTLTLSGAAVATSYEYSERSFAVVYSGLDNLNIVLEGENEIKDSEGRGACGVYTVGSLSIKGNGSLRINSVNNGMHIGSGFLTLDGAEVSVNSSSTGIWAAKDINVNKSVLKVTAEGNFANAVISDIAGTVTVTDSKVDFSSKRAALKLGDGDTDASAHALVMNSGELNLNSEKDYAIMVWNYRDPETGATSANGTITFNGGSMNVYSANGGTNLSNEKVIIAEGMGFGEGNSLSDSGFVILGKYDPITKYNLWVDGKQFTDKMTELTCGEGKASFDAGTSTLTLDNATVTSSYEYKERAFALVYSELDKLNIVVKGETKLTDGEGKSAEAVVSSGGNITVKGGKLSVSGVYVGFRVGTTDSGSLSFDGSVLDLTSSSTGLWVAKDISFNNSTASITSSGNFANAVISNIAGTMTVTNSDVSLSSKRAAIRFGAGDDDASVHALVLNAGKLNVTSDRDYGVIFWNYRDPYTNETTTNGSVTVKGGLFTLNTSSGGTNLPDEKISIAKDVYFTKGQSLSDSEVVLKAKSYLKLEPVAEIPPTCTQAGLKAHYADGNAKFGDVNAKKPLTDNQVEIPAKGHDWAEPVYTWSDDLSEVVATVVCKTDNEHMETEVAATKVSYPDKIDCEKTAMIKYTAEFENELFTAQTTEVVSPDNGHIWGEPVYKWADDYSSVTASVICQRDNSHIESETVKTTATELTKADCENGGVLRYDAVFSDSRFAAQSQTVNVPALGHSATAVGIVPASNSKDGLDGYYKCENCGKVFLDEECLHELSDLSTLTIPSVSTVKLSKTEYVYNGKAVKPAVIAKDRTGKTINSYTIDYASGRKNVGTYKVKVMFSGKYSYTKTLSFKILPKATVLSKLAAGKRKLTVYFKKQTAQTSGYRIRYSLKSSFKNAKMITVKSTKTNATLSKLKRGKKYYVQIQTYKTTGGKTYYSAWSKALGKKVK